MSLAREDDRQKNGCPSRGLGIAAAAIGVGVGAALYYFFNKRSANPSSEGSTSDWNCERPQTLPLPLSDDSYSTISEHDTSDTSINDLDVTFNMDLTYQDSDLSMAMSDSDDYSDSEDSTPSSSSDSDYSEFDVTSSSLGIPEETVRSRSPVNVVDVLRLLLRSPRSSMRERNEPTESEQMAMIRQKQFRERSWTLEECSICFDVMLRNQEVTQLPCTHNFHTECILPWFQEKQTCPNCRTVAE